MKQFKGIRALLAVILCSCMVFAGGTAIVSASDADSVSLTETYSFNDLPYHTGYSEFGYYDAGYAQYTLKVGLFDATQANFNLKAYDTWDGSNTVSLSTLSGATVSNWRWDFAENSSNVVEVKSKVNGTIKFDFEGVTLGGWFDAWPSIFGLYRYNAATGTVDTLARNFKNDNAAPLDPATYTHTVEVLEGDIVYFEIGKCNSNGYNIQEMQYGKIVVTATAVNTLLIEKYAKKLDEKVGGLTQSSYAPSDWTAINQIVADFRAGSYGSIDALIAGFDGAVSAIDAITPDPLKDKRAKLVSAMNEHVSGLVQENYAPSDWALIVAAQNEFLSGADACATEEALQALYDEKMAVINAITPDPLKDMRTNLINEMNAHVAGLSQADYKEADWAIIVGAKDAFITGAEACETEADLQALYDDKMAVINGVSPDLLKDIRARLIAEMNAYVGGLVSSNYTEANWAIIQTAKDAFIAGAEAFTVESELQAFHDEKFGEIKAVKAYKQGVVYLDYPSKMNANGYSWIEGDVFDSKLFAGTVEDLKEFDAQGANTNIMYNSAFNAGYENPAFFAENWKWYIGYNMGIITAYRAEVDMKLVITNDRISSGTAGSNGWTDDCALTYYILRGEELKQIKVVNAPSSDEDFGGTYYLKAGDILYIEFNSTVINSGEIRNIEAPCNMKAEADSTAFDQDLYAEQNNDLPTAVVNEIQAKKAELEAYYASLKEEDYSATNWLTLGQYIEQFVEKCESEVATVEDVVELYNSIKAEMQAVKTLAQAAEELRVTLEGYAAELQAEYNALVAKNEYSAENKSALDKALQDGKASILASKSKTAGNQEKIKAIAALTAVEAGVKQEEKKGCGSSLSAGMLMPLMAMAVCVLFARKKRD